MITPACPLCQTKESKLFLSLQDHYSGETFSIVKCSLCEHRYLSPAPGPEELEKYYSSNKSGASMRTAPSEIFRKLQRISFLRETDKLLSLIEKDGGIVDLGAGDGALVSCLQSEGYAVGACDFYPPEEWPHKSIPYKRVDLHGGQFQGKDVCEPLGKPPAAVVMRHVFEHLHQPAAVLTQLKMVGVKYIFIIVPNCDSPMIKLFGKNWYYWDPPRHLQFYNSRGLEEFCRNSGFQMVESGHYGLDEIVTSFHRMLQLKILNSHSSAKWLEALSHLTRPKGILAGGASALQAPFGKAVCWYLGERFAG